jgi:SAM-dependent methyltransferase
MTDKRRKQKAARASRNRRKRNEKANLIQAAVEDCWSSYATNWQHHSDQFRLGGHYQWMAGFLKNRERILEIGTGDGSGTVALFQNGSTVLSIDHNPKCHDIAEASFAAAGIAARREQRGKIQTAEAGFRIKYAAPQSTLMQGEVLLLEGDVANDDEAVLEEWLLDLPPFDAVACWNIGTYSVLVDSYGTPPQYRLRVQNVVYEIANRVLRPGGVLHIVDRGPAPSETQKDTFIDGLLDCHLDQASVTSLTIERKSIVSRQFLLASDESEITMKQKSDSGEFERSNSEMVFWSILATKP